MRTDYIIERFGRIDELRDGEAKHPRARIHLGEIVSRGMFFTDKAREGIFYCQLNVNNSRSGAASSSSPSFCSSAGTWSSMIAWPSADSLNSRKS